MSADRCCLAVANTDRDGDRRENGRKHCRRVILPATSRIAHASTVAMMLRAVVFALLTTVAATAATFSSWVDGEMGYRVTIVPADSVASRHGLRLGDILAEPAAVPERLADSGPG